MSKHEKVDKKENLLVSIIILNWNGEHLLKTCLDSVFSLAYPNYEVIFVDNASSDNSVEFVSRNYPMIKIIRNKENFGYAEGNNIGIRESRGEYVVLLNNDTRVETNWVDELVKVAESDKRIGACASKQLLFDRPHVFHTVGIKPRKNGSPTNIGDGEVDKGQYDKVMEVFAAPGASAFYRRKMLNEIGLFDSDYFVYHEEFDLGWRARLRGWKCFFVPSARVYHMRGTTTGRLSKMGQYYSERNRILTVLKNMSFGSLLKYFPYLFIAECKSLFLTIVGMVLRGHFPIAITIKIDILKALPAVIKKRHRIQNQRLVPEREIQKWF